MKFNKSVTAAIVGLLVIISVISCSKSSEGEASNTSIELSKSSVNPGENLAITGSGFNSEASTYVVFKDENGNETDVETMMVTPSSISVMVPPFFDVDQFKITSGSVSVSVVQELSDKKTVFGPSVPLEIGDLPQTGVSPGTVTMEVLKQEKNFIALALQDWLVIEDASSGLVDTSLLRSNLQSLMEDISNLESLLQPLVDGEVEQVNIGVISNKDVYLDLDALGLLDRMFIAYHFSTPSTAASSAVAASGAGGLSYGCSDISTCFRDEYHPSLANSTQESFAKFTKFSSIASDAVGLSELAARTFANAKASRAGGTFGALLFYTTTAVPSVIGASIHSFDPPILSLELGRATALGSYQPTLTNINKSNRNYLGKYKKGKTLGDLYTQIDSTSLGSVMNDVTSSGDSTVPLMDLTDPESVYSLAYKNSETIYDNIILSLADAWLGVSKIGNGDGTVTSSPTGIDCGSDCSEIFNSGTVVTLTAVPQTGSTFAGWSGACSGTGTCVMTMTADASASAEFTLASFGGAWDGNYSWTGLGEGGCTYHDHGVISMTIDINGNTFSGIASASGIELRSLPNCDVTSYITSEGTVSGTVSGNKLVGTFSFPIAETGKTFTMGWTGTFSEDGISGTFNSGITGEGHLY